MEPNFTGHKLKKLPTHIQEVIWKDLLNQGPSPTASKHFKNLGFSEVNLYQALLREYKKLQEKGTVNIANPTQPKGQLTEDEEKILQDYKDGKIGYEQMHRYLSARAMEQILRGDTDIKLSDWLRSEQIKIKKDQLDEQKDAMTIFIDSFFSGFLPSAICPHCGESTLVERKVSGERVTVPVNDAEVPSE